MKFYDCDSTRLRNPGRLDKWTSRQQCKGNIEPCATDPELSDRGTMPPAVDFKVQHPLNPIPPIDRKTVYLKVMLIPCQRHKKVACDNCAAFNVVRTANRVPV